MSTSLPVRTALRYLTPLKEGGSLPAVVDTDTGGLMVVKFRGAGQGAKALIAEVIVGLVAVELGLPIPDVAIVDMAEDFGRTEPDPEIQDILEGSRGHNFGITYLDGALNFDAVAASDLVTEELATTLVWLDAFFTNPDRSHKNPNLLVWEDRLWLIDHGAALYAHHNWSRVDEAKTHTAFKMIEQHVLLDRVGDLQAADRRIADTLSEDVFRSVLSRVPDSWLLDDAERGGFSDVTQARDRYVDYLAVRLAGPRAFVDEASQAAQRIRSAPPGPISARR